MDFSQQYLDALRSHLAAPGETGLERAYELGRHALEEEIGLLRLLAVHDEACRGLAGEAEDVRARAHAFLREVIAPFEMAFSGYRSTIVRLEQAVEERTEDLTRRTQDLERSNADLAQFAYVASHDLKEPLRMVTSYLTLVEQRYTAALDETGREFIGFAVEGAERMHHLIEALLSWSRAGSTMTVESVPLEQVLKTALKNLEPATAEAGARIEHERLPKVRGDFTKLVQVFQNLLGNALKFRSPDRPPAVFITASSSEGEVVVSVRDNGIGLETSHAERIFSMFQRLHARDEYPGTGMGLAIVRRIVEQHGGRIWLDTTPGQGTTFHFTLPHFQGSKEIP